MSKLGINIAKGILILVLAGAALLVLSERVDTVKGFFGFETVDSLKLVVKQQQTTIDEISKINKDLNKTIEETKQSGEIDTAIVSKDCQEVKTKTNKANSIIKKKDADIKIILDNGIKENIPQETIDTQVSTVQINSIWEQYCSTVKNRLCGNLKE